MQVASADDGAFAAPCPAADHVVVVGRGGGEVGIEAVGHYHRPLLSPQAWPAGWELLALNPGHVAEQRRVLGKRTIKTDAGDLEAMTEMLLAGRGWPVGEVAGVLSELTAWSARRRSRVQMRSATKNQLLGRLDRTFPGLTLALPDVLGTRVGRLVVAEFSDPARLAALGRSRFVRFAAARGLQIRRPTADKLIQAARDALPMPEAAIARAVLAADVALLNDLDAQIDAATGELDRLVPVSPFRTLTSVPGWAEVRVGNYAGALGDPSRFSNGRQIYRSAGLNPIQYESAGKRRDSGISGEGSVELRRALIDLGIGLWLNDPAAKQHAAQLKERGKKGGVIACAMGSSCRQDRVRADPRPRRVRPGQVDSGGLSDPPVHNSGRPCQARGHEGSGTDAAWVMAGTARCYAASNLATGSFAMWQPERGQKTHPE